MKVHIIETNLDFSSLSERPSTEAIVIHHTGEADIDASAEQIHDWHINNGWAGIGYHYVIRKNGDIERGRPEWAIGSHAYQHNSYTIGIHLSGDFERAYPTSKQIESCAALIADLCKRYNIVINRDNIIGHKDLMSTDCPGRNLYNQLSTIIEKAKAFSQSSQSSQISQPSQPSTAVQEDFDINKVAVLTRKYESNGDPAMISSGIGDIGGVSYGLYQFASNLGIVDDFVKWLKNYPDDALANYGRVLAKHQVNSSAFKKQWKELGTIDPGNFGKLQDEYIKEKYYDVVDKKLSTNYFHVDKHTNALRAVILSRAVQNGPSGTIRLFNIACNNMGYQNLSYIDDAYFDKAFITAIYDFLIAECDSAKMTNEGIYRSTYDFCHGSINVIYGLKNRFMHEKEDALSLL